MIFCLCTDELHINMALKDYRLRLDILDLLDNRICGLQNIKRRWCDQHDTILSIYIDMNHSHLACTHRSSFLLHASKFTSTGRSPSGTQPSSTGGWNHTCLRQSNTGYPGKSCCR